MRRPGVKTQQRSECGLESCKERVNGLMRRIRSMKEIGSEAKSATVGEGKGIARLAKDPRSKSAKVDDDEVAKQKTSERNELR